MAGTATVEKVFVDINGARQGMFIQSADSGLPVLLYLHGGMPEYFLAERHPTGLEQRFTTVWWERRGAGLSYDPRVPAATLTLDRLIADTLALTKHLRTRFGQDLWRGKLASGVSVLWDDMLTTDLAERVPELALPAYFFHGRHDYTVSYQLAKDYVGRLTAPLKGFYTFEQSAHSPLMEEPGRALRILCDDVLTQANALADGSN